MLYNDIKILKEHRKENKSSDKDLLDFAVMLLENANSSLTIETNEKIADGIRYLSSNGDWSNLIKVAQHAIEQAKIVAKKEMAYAGLDEILIFKSDTMHMGKDEFMGLLTEEAKTKYFKEV